MTLHSQHKTATKTARQTGAKTSNVAYNKRHVSNKDSNGDRDRKRRSGSAWLTLNSRIAANTAAETETEKDKVAEPGSQ